VSGRRGAARLLPVFREQAFTNAGTPGIIVPVDAFLLSHFIGSFEMLLYLLPPRVQ